MRHSFIVLFIVLALMFIGATYYVCLRTLQAFPCQKWLRITIISVFSVFSIFFLSMLFTRGTNFGHWVNTMQSISYSWMVVLLYALMFVLLFDLTRGVMHLVPASRAWLQLHLLAFRQVYMICTFGIIVILLSTGYYHFTHPQITHLTIDTQKHLDKKWNILVISDLHLGTRSQKQLKKDVQTINEMHPDLVLMVGDLFELDGKAIHKQGYDGLLRQLNPKEGVYAVYGNHEYYHEIAHNHSPELKQLFDYMHITYLVDTVITIKDKLVLVGRDDRTNSEREPLAQLMSNVDHQLPIIVMDHQPTHLEESQQCNADLQLSGHTHDGQFFPINLITKAIFELSCGYKVKGKTHYYVTSGLGLWGTPFRIGTRSEIVQITMK